MKVLGSYGFKVAESVKIKTFEVDVVGRCRCRLTRTGVHQTPEEYVYAFEIKIATTRKLLRELVEQSIVRLLVADYVYLVVPEEAEIWIDGKTKQKIAPPDILKKMCTGVYSRNLGIISLTPTGRVEVAKPALRSGMTIKELRDYALKAIDVHRTKAG